MKKKSNYTMIIGCGRLGSMLAGKLSEKGDDVMIIDADKMAFRKLPESYGGMTMVAGATDISKLMNAEIKQVDTLVVVTDNDNVNICTAQMGKELFKIPRVIARIYDDEKENLLKPLHIDVICPSELSQKEIAHFINWKEEGHHERNCG